MISLACIFTMEKIIFGHKFFICQLIFKIFVVLFKTFAKRQFPKDGVSRVGL